VLVTSVANKHGVEHSNITMNRLVMAVKPPVQLVLFRVFVPKDQI
jgi:hypothetical protein